MDGINLDSDPTLTQAMEQLSRMEAADAGTPDKTGQTQDTATASATAAADNNAPADTKADTSTSPEPKPDQGAPATTDDANTATKDKDKEKDAGQTTADDPTKSKFAKNQERQQKTWAQINAEKEALKKEREDFKKQQEEFTRAQQEFKDAQAKASKPKYTAQQYADFAKQAEADAEELEKTQEYDKADEKRLLAKKAREFAEHLRLNPPKEPATDAQKEAEYQKLQKEWYSKAAIDFPEVVKQGSPQQQALANLIKNEPAVLNDPKGMYYAARLVAAESVAASVPAKDKELGELRAKVKELEGKLTVPGLGAATNPGGDPGAPLSEEQQRAELYAMAKGMPS